jgi:Helix-turn-helix domain
MELREMCVHLKVSELALRYRFSVDTIYAWVRTELIPPACLLRVGNSIRIDSDQFDSLLRAGKLYRPRSRKREERARNSRQAAASLGLSEDQHTTKMERGQYEHRFVSDSGAVSADHPYRSTLTERAE